MIGGPSFPPVGKPGAPGRTIGSFSTVQVRPPSRLRACSLRTGRSNANACVNADSRNVLSSYITTISLPQIHMPLLVGQPFVRPGSPATCTCSMPAGVGVGIAAVVATFDVAEPDGLNAITRYVMACPAGTEVTLYTTERSGTSATGVNVGPPATFCSTVKPVSLVELSVHARFTCVGDTRVAMSPVGAAGGAGASSSTMSTSARSGAPIT